ncbi:uncharacterized protein V1510DRAFT_358855, partial [Dipodascopsis tothii]|uniref:uncharacterized protein n=1 Tax=Dipodascopsis tothii TaxID=44089 RepID=UPI0034CE9A87
MHEQNKTDDQVDKRSDDSTAGITESTTKSTQRSAAVNHGGVFAVNDDSVIQHEPSRHVDYLSHNWQESDLSSSWRYVVLRRKNVANSARLENASWRTWTKAKYNLKTVSPESVNWLKDYDVTWLYGPLFTPQKGVYHPSPPTSKLVTPPGRVSSSAPSYKKPILKKRSMSEVMLNRSRSSSNLIKQAAASVKAQRHLRMPGTRPTTASYSAKQSTFPEALPMSSVGRLYEITPTAASPSSRGDKPNAERRIHFSDRVEQCIALEAKDYDEDGPTSVSTSPAVSTDDERSDNEEEEPGLFLMVRSASGSFQRPASLEPHTIAKLPSTRLKYVRD